MIFEDVSKEYNFTWFLIKIFIFLKIIQVLLVLELKMLIWELISREISFLVVTCKKKYINLENLNRILT